MRDECDFLFARLRDQIRTADLTEFPLTRSDFEKTEGLLWTCRALEEQVKLRIRALEEQAELRIRALEKQVESLNWPSAEITPLRASAWETVISPGCVVTTDIVHMKGEPQSAGAYIAVSEPYWLRSGAEVAATGTVLSGGLTLGLLNDQGHWAVQTSIRPGPFGTSVTAPAAGVYRVVLANNLPDGQTFNSMWVLAVAFIGEPGEPAKRRSEPAKRRSEPAKRRSKGFGSAFRAMRDKLHWGRNSSSKRLGQGRKIVHDTVRDNDEPSAKIPGA
jgi:hypothetical protein